MVLYRSRRVEVEQVQPEVYVSTASARNPRDLPSVLERFLGTGIRQIELSAPHPYLPTAEIDRVLADGRARGARFIVHNYFPTPQEAIVLNLAAAKDRDYRATHALIGEALGIAERAGARLYTCHAGYRAHATCPPSGYFDFEPLNDDLIEKADSRQRKSLSRVLAHPAVESLAVRFAFENLFPCYDEAGSNVSYCCTPSQIEAQLVAFSDQGLGLLLDLGHLVLAANMLGFDKDQALDRLIDTCGGRLFEVHLSGNDGQKDLHRPLEPQDWQLEALARLSHLGGLGEGLYFTLEARGLHEEQILTQVDLIHRALARRPV